MARWNGYTSTTKRISLNPLQANGATVTSLGVGESVTWQMTTSPEYGAGTVLASGSGTHDTRPAYTGKWYADVTLPATAQTVYLHWIVSYGGFTEYWRDTIQVKERS